MRTAFSKEAVAAGRGESANQAARDLSNRDSAPEAGGELSVLYIDADDASARMFVADMQVRGIHVDTARTCEQALGAAAATSHRAIVLASVGLAGNSEQLLAQLLAVRPHAAYVRLLGPDEDRSALMPGWHAVVSAPCSAYDMHCTLLEASHKLGRGPDDSISDYSLGRQILLLEDDDGDAELFKAFLLASSRDRNDRVVRVHDLAGALEALHAQDYDLIVSDLGLPDANGLDVVRQLHTATSKTPIVVISGVEDEEIASQSVQLGAQDYLVKGRIDKFAIGRALRYAAERKRSERRLAYLAHHDQLTGLANRVTFHERVAHAHARATRHRRHFAIMFLDVDHFKAVNDTWGHAAGDELLLRTAERLTQCVRDYDTVARLGGDEFAVLLEDPVDEACAMQMADRIRASVTDPISIAGRELSVSTSIGVAVHPSAGLTATDLLKSADTAMYAAKGAGRNRVRIFSSAQRFLATSRSRLEQQLRVAARNADFHVHYQPQIDARTDLVVGFEALMRWSEADVAIPPSQFVPILEDTGLIVSVGAWILDRACAQLRTWHGQGMADLHMAVNVSARQFDEPEFVEMVLRTVANHELANTQLELEVTESLLMRDPEQAIRQLHRLRDAGVRIALDDFGTGYSSLSHLRQAPIDVLKIDRSFVKPLGEDRSAEMIVGTIIELGHKLGMSVVAEGVETVMQLAHLHEYGCDTIQGYLVARPQAIWDTRSVQALRSVLPMTKVA